MMSSTAWLAVIASLLVVFAIGMMRERLRLRAVREGRPQTPTSPPTRPETVHPQILHDLCQGCGQCVEACPEMGALRVIDDKAHLVDRARCQGHGECKDACPSEAIDLVLQAP